MIYQFSAIPTSGIQTLTTSLSILPEPELYNNDNNDDVEEMLMAHPRSSSPPEYLLVASRWAEVVTGLMLLLQQSVSDNQILHRVTEPRLTAKYHQRRIEESADWSDGTDLLR